MNDNEIKPLPCPFCGEELEFGLEYFHHPFNGCVISMVNENALMIGEDEIENWNNRVSK